MAFVCEDIEAWDGQQADVANVTKFYYTFLRTGIKKYNDDCVKILNIGKPRSGKTAVAFDQIDTLMNAAIEGGIQREICLFRGHPHLEELLNKYSPFRGFIYRTSRLEEVKPYSVVYVDEGITTMSAKEALLVENRQLEKALAYMSHQGVVFIVNAQDDGVLKALRTKADMTIYKRLSEDYVIESDHYVVKQFGEQLQKLPHDRGFLSSNAFGLEKKGIIQTKLVEWWNDELSKNLGGASLNSELDREKEVQIIIDETVKTVLEVFGPKQALKAKFSGLISGYMQENDLATYKLLETRLRKVADRCAYRAWVDLKKKKDDEEGITGPSLSPVRCEPGDPFSSYCRDVLKNNPQVAEIIWLYLQGTGQKDLAKMVKCSVGTVNNTIGEFQGSKQGNLFEIWWDATHPGGKRGGGNRSIPDFITKDGRIQSLKCQADVQKSLTFYQDSPDQRHSLKPEYDAAKIKGEMYDLVLYNPKWSTEVLIQVVDPNGDNKVVVNKSEKKRK